MLLSIFEQATSVVLVSLGCFDRYVLTAVFAEETVSSIVRLYTEAGSTGSPEERSKAAPKSTGLSCDFQSDISSES